MKIPINKEHLEYLQRHGIDVLQALKDNDLDLVLEIIDAAIVDDIVDNHDEITTHGIYLQKIYDQIAQL